MTRLFYGLFLTTAITGSATVALSCPVARDLETGILFATADGITEVHTIIRDNTIQIEERYNDGTGEGSVTTYRKGVYMQTLIPIEENVILPHRLETYISPSTMRNWRDPVPDAQWDNPASDGGTAVSGPMQRVEIGNCTYDGFEVLLNYSDDPGYSETYMFIPSLGTSMLIETNDQGGREVYEYVSISKQ